MKPTTKKLLSITLSILIVTLFVFYISRHLEDFKQLELVNYPIIVVLAVIILLSSTFNGMMTDFLVSAFGIKLRLKEWFGLSVITTFYNIITPFRGGMAARAVYLKHKHNFSYSNFLAALAGTYIMSFLIAAFFGLVSLCFLYKQLKIFSPLVLLIFLIFFIPLLLIFIFSPKFSETKSSLANKIINVMNGWHLIHKQRKLVTIVAIISTIQLFMGAFSYIVSYYIFSIQISLAQAIFMSSFGTFAILISITPAGLGIQEGVSVFSALAIGITPAQAISVAVLNRVITMVVMFTLGPIFSYILLKHKPKETKK
jgi:uncharacterized protein (TIRG00374 family)